MIVADANLVAYLLLPSDATDDAEAVFAKDSRWVVPTLCASELRSVVMKYVRLGKLELADAVRAMERAELIMSEFAAPVDSRRVLELAAASKCSSYDCEYVALAEALGVELVTNDAKMLKAFPGRARGVRAFAA